MQTLGLPRYYFPFFCLLLVYLMALMIGPRQPDDIERKRCQINVYLKKPFGVTVDCDAPGFLETASDFKKLLDPKAVRQSRPGLIFLSSCMSYVVRPLANILVKWTHPTFPTIIAQKQQRGFIEFPAPFLSYAILNFLFLCFAFILVKQVVTSGKLTFSAACVLLMLAFNDVIKVYFFSPHTQIFNIFLPVLLLWTAHKIYNEDFFKKPKMYLLMALSGYGLTCYGTFLLLPIVAMSTEVARRKFENNKLSITLLDIKRITIFAILFCAPMLLWSAYVISINGKIFFYEAEACGQFFWIKNVYQEKGILVLVRQWIINFYVTLSNGLKFVPITLILATVSFSFLKKYKLRINEKLCKLAILCICISFLYTIFFASQGYFATRISLVIFIPTWIWIAALNQHIEDSIKDANLCKKIFFTLILGQGIYTVANSSSFTP